MADGLREGFLSLGLLLSVIMRAIRRLVMLLPLHQAAGTAFWRKCRAALPVPTVRGRRDTVS